MSFRSVQVLIEREARRQAQASGTLVDTADAAARFVEQALFNTCNGCSLTELVNYSTTRINCGEYKTDEEMRVLVIKAVLKLRSLKKLQIKRRSLSPGVLKKYGAGNAITEDLLEDDGTEREGFMVENIYLIPCVIVRDPQKTTTHVDGLKMCGFTWDDTLKQWELKIPRRSTEEAANQVIEDLYKSGHFPNRLPTFEHLVPKQKEV